VAYRHLLLHQLKDSSAREPMKVVPSCDTTPGRRMEPLNRRSPNGTSCHLAFPHGKGNLLN